MKYLEKAINFFIKHYILAIPLFISTVLVALLGGSTSLLMGIIRNFTNQMRFGTDFFTEPFGIIKIIATTAIASGIGLISLILKLVVNPATYGMINKALDEGYATFNDFVPQLKNNFARYLIYWLGNIVIWIILVIAIVLISLVGTLITVLIRWTAIRVLFVFFVFLLFIIAAIYIEVNMALWFPAMMIDNLDVISAFKRSFTLVKRNFWMILGISVLVSIVASIANLVLGVFGIIPLIGAIILGIIPTASTFIMMVFYLMYYKSAAESPQL